MNFKEQAENDLLVTFFNCGEFAETHIINGKEMDIVPDNDELAQRKKGMANDFTEGAYEGDLLFYVRKEVYGKRPDIGAVITFDGAKHRITGFSGDTGMYTITLVKNLAGKRGR